jgi:hypothetical protein
MPDPTSRVAGPISRTNSSSVWPSPIDSSDSTETTAGESDTGTLLHEQPLSLAALAVAKSENETASSKSFIEDIQGVLDPNTRAAKLRESRGNIWRICFPNPAADLVRQLYSDSSAAPRSLSGARVAHQPTASVFAGSRSASYAPARSSYPTNRANTLRRRSGIRAPDWHCASAARQVLVIAASRRRTLCRLG